MIHRGVTAYIRILLTWAFALCALGLYAAPTLQWDPNPEPDILGYRVYIGTQPGEYSRSVDVGPATSYVLSGLDPGETHYFAITAYTSEQVESPFSDEVVYTPPVDGFTAQIVPFTLVPIAGIASIQFPGVVGQRIRVLATSDFETWTEVHSTSVSISGVVSFEDGQMDKAARFYRVVASL